MTTMGRDGGKGGFWGYSHTPCENCRKIITESFRIGLKKSPRNPHFPHTLWVEP
jgi:hypothetical protein